MGFTEDMEGLKSEVNSAKSVLANSINNYELATEKIAYLSRFRIKDIGIAIASVLTAFTDDEWDFQEAAIYEKKTFHKKPVYSFYRIWVIPSKVANCSYLYESEEYDIAYEAAFELPRITSNDAYAQFYETVNSRENLCLIPRGINPSKKVDIIVKDFIDYLVNYRYENSNEVNMQLSHADMVLLTSKYILENQERLATSVDINDVYNDGPKRSLTIKDHLKTIAND